MKSLHLSLAAMRVLAAAAVVTLPVQEASAQARNEQKPTAESRTNQAQVSGWSTSCAATERDAPLDCLLEQRIFAPQTTQPLVSVKVRVVGAGQERILVVATPLGPFLPAGVTIRVDRAEPKRLDLHTCDAAGCYAFTDLSNELVGLMKAGRDFSVTFQNLSQEEINVTMPLQGFSDGLAKIE